MVRNWEGGLFSVLIVQVSVGVGVVGCVLETARAQGGRRGSPFMTIRDRREAVQLHKMNFLVRKVLQLIVRSGRLFLKSGPKFPP